MPKSPHLQARIDVTPFVGVLLALVVVMLATTRTSTASTLIDLPPSAPCDCANYDEPLTVSVFKAGEIKVNDRPSSLATLAADICLARPVADCIGATVYLDASVDASYGDFARTVDRLRLEGFDRMALMNKDFSQP